MSKYFNVNGDCKPELHYMVDLSDKIQQIKAMVDNGQYFTINRARQYGKTTTLHILEKVLQKDYLVISIDFQMLSHADFDNEQNFVAAFCREILDAAAIPSPKIKKKLVSFAEKNIPYVTLSVFFKCLQEWFKESEKKVVLIIDEVDSATNNQVFFDFLSQLRGYYIKREKIATFQSVILAGVYDIKNLKRNIRTDEQKRFNSPWNIASDFLIDMSFSPDEIIGMLEEYEKDSHINMDIPQIAQLLYDYTSGYPYLISKICKLMDERVIKSTEFSTQKSVWTKKGFLKAVRILLEEPNTLFDSLVNKLEDDKDLDKMLRALLFQGKEITYVIGVHSIEMALMFGFVKKTGNSITIANRIFETLLYNLFLATPTMQQEPIYDAALKNKNQYIENGHLNMTLVLEKFVKHFSDLYGDRDQTFYEEDGRRYFMLFLKPIINGTGNCYIEAETRNRERTDLIVDYAGEQFIVETKIWYGNAYHMRGERQLADYLEHYHLKKGYMLSFSFNKKKEVGVKEIVVGDKVLVEAVV